MARRKQERELKYKITASSDVDKAFRKVRGRIDGLRKQIFNLRNAIAGAGVGLVVRDVVVAANEQERAVAGVETALRSMGRYTPEMSAGLQDLATAMQAVTNYGDEAVLEGQKFLLTYRDISDDLLPRTTEAMLDLATLMGGDLPNAANKLGKASMGMTGELREVGITVDQDVYKLRGYVGVLEEIEKQVKGQARAARQASGPWAALGNQIGDFKEQVGLMVREVFDPLGDEWIWLLDGMTAEFREFVRSADFQEWADDASDAVLDGFEAAALGVAGFVDTIGPVVSGLGDSVDSMWDGFKSLPGWVQEVGIVGALLGGRKGKALLLLMAAVADQINQFALGAEAYLEGRISFGEWATSNDEELEGLLKQRGRDNGAKPPSLQESPDSSGVLPDYHRQFGVPVLPAAPVASSSLPALVPAPAPAPVPVPLSRPVRPSMPMVSAHGPEDLAPGPYLDRGEDPQALRQLPEQLPAAGDVWEWGEVWRLLKGEEDPPEPGAEMEGHGAWGPSWGGSGLEAMASLLSPREVFAGSGAESGPGPEPEAKVEEGGFRSALSGLYDSWMARKEKAALAPLPKDHWMRGLYWEAPPLQDTHTPQKRSLLYKPPAPEVSHDSRDWLPGTGGPFPEASHSGVGQVDEEVVEILRGVPNPWQETALKGPFLQRSVSPSPSLSPLPEGLPSGPQSAVAGLPIMPSHAPVGPVLAEGDGGLQEKVREVFSRIRQLKEAGPPAEGAGASAGAGSSGPDAVAAAARAGTAAVGALGDEWARVRDRLVLDIDKAGLNQFDARLVDIRERAEELRAKFGDKPIIESWVGVQEGQVEADRHEARQKYQSQQEHVERQAAEDDIRLQMTGLDLAERRREIDRPTLLKERLRLQYELLDLWGDNLKTMDKAADPAGWYAQAEAIQVARGAIVDLQDELEAVEGNWSDGFKRGFDDFVDSGVGAFGTWAEAGFRASEALQTNFSDVFFDAFEGELKDAEDYFKAWGQTLNRILADALARMAAQWALAKIGFGAPGGYEYHNGAGGLMGTISQLAPLAVGFLGLGGSGGSGATGSSGSAGGLGDYSQPEYTLLGQSEMAAPSEMGFSVMGGPGPQVTAGDLGLSLLDKYHSGGEVRPNSTVAREMGLATDEVPAILQTGEVVLSRRDLAAMVPAAAGADRALRELGRDLPRFHQGGVVRPRFTAAAAMADRYGVSGAPSVVAGGGRAGAAGSSVEVSVGPIHIEGGQSAGGSSAGLAADLRSQIEQTVVEVVRRHS